MTAYYNEIDPYCAAWLRNLISANLITPGQVDERDIRDIAPADLVGYSQHHFFAGIGGWSRALRLAGWPDDRAVWTGSCPCQPFSTAGRAGGFDDERHLWPFWQHLISVYRPATILGEQVASPAGLGWFDLVHADLETEGYAVGAADLCAAGVGAPHIRQRLWFVANDTESRREPRRGRSMASDGRETPWFESGRLRDAGELGDSTINGSGAQHGQPGASARPQEPLGANQRTVGPPSVASGGELEHTARDGREQWGTEPSGRSLVGGCGTSELADSDEGQRGRLANGEGCERDGSSTGWEQSNRQFESSGVIRSYWSDAEWIACRDGKWRAVEPGSFPLAHGAPARVGRLRAYGNAICAEVAAEFIIAVMDA